MKAPRHSTISIPALLFALSAGPASADYKDEVLADSPIGYWRLGEAAGAASAVDASGNDRHLDYTLFLDGDFGQEGAIIDDLDTAARFTPTPGANAPAGNPSTHPSVVSPNSTDFGFAAAASFTLEYWIKALPGNASTNSAGILVKGYSTIQTTPWYLSRYNQGAVDFFLRDINNTSIFVDSASGVADGVWHQVVCVYDSAAAEIQIYIDGALEASAGGIPADAYSTNAEPFTLANHLNRAFDGWLDEVAVYDKALSAARIAAHYDAAGIIADEGGGATPLLAVDFGSSISAGAGPGGVQVGFSEFEDAEANGLDPVTLSFASGAAAVDGQVDVTIEGFTHWRDYAAVAATYGLDALLSDNVLRNADGTMTLTIDSLKAGTYNLTTYHVSTQFGGGSFAMSLDDALGLNEISPAIPVGRSGELQRIEFEVVSNGSPVALVMTGGAGQQHLSLNGFTIAGPDGPPLAITDVQYDTATRTAEFTWNSRPGAEYKVDWSVDGTVWIEFDDGYPSDGESTTYTDADIPAGVTRRLYRVVRN